MSAGRASGVGKMFFSKDLAYWVGRSRAVSGRRRAGRRSGCRWSDRRRRLRRSEPVLLGGALTLGLSQPCPSDVAGGSPRSAGRSVDGVVGRRRLEIGAMETRSTLGGFGADLEASSARTADSQAASRGRSTASISALAPARVHDDEPDQPGSDDEPDDEQPDVELGIHPRRSIGSRRRYTSADARLHPEPDRVPARPAPRLLVWDRLRASVSRPPTWSWSGSRSGPARTRTSSATG